MTVDAAPAGSTPTLRGVRVLLGVTGGIAAYKAALVARLLVKAGAEVDTVLTRGAREFIGAPTFEGITGRPARTEVWEDVAGSTHVQVGRDADVVVVYPTTAHTLAKVANGFADDLLTNSLLVARCPVVMAPAMHTEMWEHPATQRNVATLRERGHVIVGPAEGELMGGDVGPGRVVEPEVILAELERLLAHRDDLVGRTVVVTAGGTREALDPVRFLGNRSTGKMGFAIAAEAARRGARVHLVAGPTHLLTPTGVQRHDVVSALDMHAEVMALAESADVVVKAAAVADFRPASAATRKIKKAEGVPTIELQRNPDILAELGTRERGERPVLVGFAAETHDAEEHGREKLERKRVDLLVVNDVSAPDAGFGVDTNRVLILHADGRTVEVPLSTKAEVAGRLWDEVLPALS